MFDVPKVLHQCTLIERYVERKSMKEKGAQAVVTTAAWGGSSFISVGDILKEWTEARVSISRATKQRD